MGYFIGVDVGTQSARAGVFDATGQLLSSHSVALDIWRPRTGFAQQSSGQIWTAICATVKSALAASSVDPKNVIGIGFDATCSLVLVDEDGTGVTVSPNGEPEQDVILWADHRATDIAAEIDQTGHDLLQISGGTISPEMQLPKLCWLQRNLPDSWRQTKHFFDLPDWLTWRATGSLTRSQCSVVCKWTYRGTGEGWDSSLFEQIGLQDLVSEGFARIGTAVSLPGECLGPLSDEAAQELGLKSSTMVGVSMIDAHAGALGTLGIGRGASKLALVAGTSACHIVVGPEAAFVPGVWGPYKGVVFPTLWANEAGQSMAGAAIDTVLKRHSKWKVICARAQASGQSPYEILEQILHKMSGADDVTLLSKDRHIVPDFNGNRSPLADPHRRGVTSGQRAVADDEDLALDYLAVIQSLAYGTKQILERLETQGVCTSEIVLSGGLAKNALYCQTHADVTGCTVIIPDQTEPVLVGSAMLGATAAGAYESLEDAASSMCGAGIWLSPNKLHREYHAKKYACFLAMQDHFQHLASLMKSE
ncbi:FGGY-family carbohydrate kinase [Cognatishimia maritima]|nr:FGGY-family carbohydrate kinase [Cognatishimia maritima]